MSVTRLGTHIAILLADSKAYRCGNAIVKSEQIISIFYFAKKYCCSLIKFGFNISEYLEYQVITYQWKQCL